MGLVPSILLLLSAAQTGGQVQVRIDSRQPHALLAFLNEKGAWDGVTRTEAFIRLKKRESEMGRAFTGDSFRAFVESPELKLRAEALSATLKQWEQTDVAKIVDRIRIYLPPEAVFKATIYIMIKPQTNSFVYEPATNPAIFLYLDPGVSPAEFENTVAHELHHIGLASVARQARPLPDAVPPNIRAAIGWLGAFGEGVAMLAAAGSAGTHPHLNSSPDDRARWDRDVANFESDMRRVEAFLMAIINGGLTEAQQRQQGMTFFGTQGPWYTVGWKMAVSIEKTLGRSVLVSCLRDMRDLLVRYNRVAEQTSMPRWSTELLNGIQTDSR